MSHVIQTRADLRNAKRVVVKVGSSSLTADDGRLDTTALRDLVAVLVELRATGAEVVLVSSGAIAAGIAPLGLSRRPVDVATAQAAASVGQGLLVARYAEAFGAQGITVGQVLLTAEDVVRRGRYRNAHRTLSRLLGLGAVPIVNENDTVVTDEIRVGDNDRLAALVSHLVHADALILLTDVDALYTAPPSRPGATRIGEVVDLQELERVEVSGRGSAVGTGGMVTKMDAVRIATGAGVPVGLTNTGQARDLLFGADVGTWFQATGRRRSTRQLWLAYAARIRGQLVLDEGAVHAVCDRRSSLLPVGIVSASGDFQAGDPVELVGPDAVVVAKGLTAYDADEVAHMLSLTSRTTPEVSAAFDRDVSKEVVHADDLVVLCGRHAMNRV